MNLRDSEPVKIVTEAFVRYRKKELDLDGLQEEVWSAISLLDGDLPKAVRRTVEWVDNALDTVRAEVDEADQADEVDRVWRELDEVIARHEGPPGSE